jgi:cardiolipin synthase
VRVLVPGKIDHNLVRQASRAGFGGLLQAGIEIYEYRSGLLHAKTMVIDGVWATIGSTNLDNVSFAVNDVEEDLAHAHRITYEAWKDRGLTERLIELLALPIRDLL